MECKFFVRLFAFHIFTAFGDSGGTALVDLFISGAPIRNEAATGSCGADLGKSLSVAFGLWISVQSTDVQVSVCRKGENPVRTSTSTTTRPVSSFSSSFSSVSSSKSSSVSDPTSTSTTALPVSSISTTQASTSSSGGDPTMISTTSQPTSSGPFTSSSTFTRSDSSITMNGSTTTKRETTTSASWKSSSSSTFTSNSGSACPAIPPPKIPGSYSVDERNAYCISAVGSGSYCKCSQIPARQLCQSVRRGSGLKCDCSNMCESQFNRRLLSVGESVTNIEVSFSVISEASMTQLLESLSTNGQAFQEAMGFNSSVNITIVSFIYKPRESRPVTSLQGGTVYAPIILEYSTISSMLRRLSQANLSLQEAVSQSVAELVPLPLGSRVNCLLANSSSSSVIANVSIEVPSDLNNSTNSVAFFLQADVNGGGSKLPELISNKSDITVMYANGYIPIVWYTVAAVLIAVAVLPYILGGVGVGVIVLALLIYRYRYILKSKLREIIDILKIRSENLRSSGWNKFRFLSRFPETDKMEFSSTPDTATNFDEDEFDEFILRGLRRHPRPL